MYSHFALSYKCQSIQPMSQVNYLDPFVLTSLKIRENKVAHLKNITIHAIHKIRYYKTTFTTEILRKETKLEKLSDEREMLRLIIASAAK